MKHYPAQRDAKEISRPEGLGEKNPVRETNAASAVYVHARSQRWHAHLSAIEVFASLKDGNGLCEGGVQDAARFAGQCGAIFHSELREQRRDMKFHGPHGDTQLGRNLFVGAMMDHGVQNFALPGAERGRMRY